MANDLRNSSTIDLGAVGFGLANDC